MYYIDPNHNTLQNVLACTLYIYTVHTNKCCKYAVGLCLCVVLRDFKCLQETTSVLCRGLSDMYMGRSTTSREETKKGKSIVDCMCIVSCSVELQLAEADVFNDYLNHKFSL